MEGGRVGGGGRRMVGMGEGGEGRVVEEGWRRKGSGGRGGRGRVAEEGRWRKGRCWEMKGRGTEEGCREGQRCRKVSEGVEVKE